MDDEKTEYRGFLILWRDPLDAGAWMAIITAACPSLFPAIAPNETIDGRDRDDMLGNAKAYIDRLLDHALAAWSRLWKPATARRRMAERVWRKRKSCNVPATNALTEQK
jgi:hypothetical protein